MIVRGPGEGENGPNLELGTHLESRPQAEPPLNHHGKEFANNNGLLIPLLIDKGGKELQQPQEGGGIKREGGRG